MHGITIAGIGPGNPDYLTIEVKKTIEEAEYILAFGRVCESLKSFEKEFIKVKRVEEIIDYISNHEDVLLLASGDPCFYGITDFLKTKNIAIEKILPGISSFQYMMTKLKKSWQGAQLLSLHGRQESLDKAKNNRLSIILTDMKNPPSQISQKLKAIGAKGQIYVGYNLSYDDERIIEAEIGEDIEDISALSVVVVEIERDFIQCGVLPPLNVSSVLKWIKDEEFIRGSIPMTKFNIRILNMAYLSVEEGDRLLDIGAGTGSISIEAALQGAKVWAIEREKEAVDLINKNKAKFGVDITIIEGQAPEDLPDMKFNKCFVGGSNGYLKEIFEYMQINLESKGILCANFITLNNLNVFIELLKLYNYEDIEVQLIQSSAIDKLGLLKGNNPIFIVKGVKK